MVESEMGLVDLPQALEYINKIGNRLVDQLDSRTFDYRFFIVDMAEPNAFSLPGGYVYISRGLLALINDESELAGIIGHEIIHAHNRHSYKQMKRSIFPGILKLPGNIIGIANKEVGALINAPIGAATGLTMAKYSRKHEYEADKGGLQLAANAGYDPMALATALNNLNKDVEYLLQKKTKFNYFDDHPYTQDRIDRILDETADIQWQAKPHFAPSKELVYMQLDGLYLGQNPAQGIFRGTTFYHANLNFGIKFPDGWSTMNTPRYIAAGDKTNGATVVWGVLADSPDPDEIAEALVAKLKKEYRIDRYRSESTTIWGYKAHIFAIDQLSRGERINFFMCWIKTKNKAFQMIGSGPKPFEDAFESTARSFHSLTEDERNQITGVVLRLRKGHASESLEAFGGRTKNNLTQEYTSIINALPTQSTLEQGQPLKIGVQELYPPK